MTFTFGEVSHTRDLSHIWMVLSIYHMSLDVFQLLEQTFEVVVYMSFLYVFNAILMTPSGLPIIYSKIPFKSLIFDFWDILVPESTCSHLEV